MSARSEFETWLIEQGKAESTAKFYGRISQRIGDADPLTWLVEAVTPDTPKGTRTALLGAAVNLARFRTGDMSLKAPELVKPRKRVHYGRDALSEEDVQAYEELLAECGIAAASRAILRLLPWTGLRIGEMCAVTRDNVTMRRSPQKIPGIEVVGKGGKIRWVPLMKPAIAILRDYLKEAEEDGIDNVHWLFTSSKSPKLHVRPSTVRRCLQDIRDQLPMTARAVTPHVLRHTCATRLHAAGVDLLTIQTILGHADLDTTRIYLHPSRSTIAEAFKKL